MISTRYTKSHYAQANKQGWDIRTPIHISSSFYNVEAFKHGEQQSLNPTELGLLGNLNGQSVLHLQCHFGLDTLSLAKLGATVTGIDISDVSVSEARKLSEETGIPATFLCADVQALADYSVGMFDIVFTSYGVLPWLEDLDAWAQGITRHLVDGGRLVLVEYHPVIDLFHNGKISGWDAYFNQNEPDWKVVHGTYTDPNVDISFERYTWQHSLSEVIMALINAGLNLKDFCEYPFSSYPLFSELRNKTNYGWFNAQRMNRFPYMYSLVMNKMSKSIISE
jgi:SAM-dependent methyltransferase